MTIQGLHHITLVCSNAQRTVTFYTNILGLRFVKKTVNFDDPTSYHLYFGDDTGIPGSVITFFEWPGSPPGAPGIGGTHHFALQVADDTGLLKWKRRLTDLGLHVDGPLNRNYFKSLYFRDPDGVILEIATYGPGWTVDEDAAQLGSEYRPVPPEIARDNADKERIAAETWPEPVPVITPDMTLKKRLHHITAIGSNIQRTHAFFGEFLDLRLLKMTSNFDDPESAHWYWGIGNGEPGTLITYFEHNPAKARPVRMGAGQTHHFALAVPDEATQLEWRERLVRAGIPVSPVMDRIYFKSIYTRDPNGHIVGLATAGPGFAVDEDVTTLGEQLRLPPWLEHQRDAIESRLRPISIMTPEGSEER